MIWEGEEEGEERGVWGVAGSGVAVDRVHWAGCTGQGALGSA